MATGNKATPDIFIKQRFDMALPWLKELEADETIEVDVELLDATPNLKRFTIRHHMSVSDLAALSEPGYATSPQQSRKQNIAEYSTDVFKSVRELVLMIFDWADAEPYFDQDEYAGEFEGRIDDAEGYDPPLDLEASGLSSLEAWTRSEHFDSDEDMYRRLLETGNWGYTFTLTLNDRGREMLEILSS